MGSTGSTSEEPATVISTRQDLAAAAVAAILDGTPAERQHIVDTLGSRAQQTS